MADDIGENRVQQAKVEMCLDYMVRQGARPTAEIKTVHAVYEEGLLNDHLTQYIGYMSRQAISAGSEETRQLAAGYRDSFRSQYGNVYGMARPEEGWEAQKEKLYSWFRTSELDKVVDYVKQIDPAQNAQELNNAIDILIVRTGEMGQAPCGIDHDSVNVVARLYDEAPNLTKVIASRIAHFLSRKDTKKYVKNAMVEIINTLNWRSWHRKADPGFAQLLSEEMQPFELMEALRECTTIYADIFSTFCKMYLSGPIEVKKYEGNDIVLSEEMRVVMKGYNNTSFMIERDGMFIGSVYVSSTDGKNIDLLVHIFDKDSTHRGIGTMVVQWVAERIKTPGSEGIVSFFIPADEPHLKLFLSCRRNGIFQKVEAISSEVSHSYLVSPLNPEWQEVQDLKQALHVQRAHENLFVRGRMLPSSTSQPALIDYRHQLNDQQQTVYDTHIGFMTCDDTTKGILAGLIIPTDQGGITRDQAAQLISQHLGQENTSLARAWITGIPTNVAMARPAEGQDRAIADNCAILGRLTSERKATVLFGGGGGTYSVIQIPEEDAKRLKKSSRVRSLLEAAERVLGYDVYALLTDSDYEYEVGGERLKSEQLWNNTEFSCTALVVRHIMYYEFIREQSNDTFRPMAAGGNSYGHMPALIVAGVLSFEDGLKVTKKIAEEMEKVRKLSEESGEPQGMMKVSGLSREELLGALGLRGVKGTGLPGIEGRVEISVSFNSDSFILCGYRDGLDAFTRWAIDKGYYKDEAAAAEMTFPVFAAYHGTPCNAVATAVEAWIDAGNIVINSPSDLEVEVFGNTTGQKLETAEEVRADLIAWGPDEIKWKDTVDSLLGLEYDAMLEIFPRLFLTGFLSADIAKGEVTKKGVFMGCVTALIPTDPAYAANSLRDMHKVTQLPEPTKLARLDADAPGHEATTTGMPLTRAQDRVLRQALEGFFDEGLMNYEYCRIPLDSDTYRQLDPDGELAELEVVEGVPRGAALYVIPDYVLFRYLSRIDPLETPEIMRRLISHSGTYHGTAQNVFVLESRANQMASFEVGLRRRWAHHEAEHIRDTEAPESEINQRAPYHDLARRFQHIDAEENRVDALKRFINIYIEQATEFESILDRIIEASVSERSALYTALVEASRAQMALVGAMQNVFYVAETRALLHTLGNYAQAFVVDGEWQRGVFEGDDKQEIEELASILKETIQKARGYLVKFQSMRGIVVSGFDEQGIGRVHFNLPALQARHSVYHTMTPEHRLREVSLPIVETERLALYQEIGNHARRFVEEHAAQLHERILHLDSPMVYACAAARELEREWHINIRYSLEEGENHTRLRVWVVTEDGHIIDPYPLNNVGGEPRYLDEPRVLHSIDDEEGLYEGGETVNAHTTFVENIRNVEAAFREAEFTDYLTSREHLTLLSDTHNASMASREAQKGGQVIVPQEYLDELEQGIVSSSDDVEVVSLEQAIALAKTLDRDRGRVVLLKPEDIARGDVAQHAKCKVLELQNYNPLHLAAGIELGRSILAEDRESVDEFYFLLRNERITDDARRELMAPQSGVVSLILMEIPIEYIPDIEELRREYAAFITSA